MELSDKYHFAILMHNKEFAILGQRTNAFLLVQSILMGGFILILVNSDSFYGSFELFAIAVAMMGLLFCIMNIKGGWASASSAMKWRVYIMSLENGDAEAPFNSFISEFKHNHKDSGFHLNCEGCQINVLPYPTSWLFNSFIFIFSWFAGVAYILISHIVKNHILESCQVLANIGVFVFFMVMAGAICTYHYIKWRHSDYFMK